MKTIESIEVGELLIVIRSDGGVYIGRPVNGLMDKQRIRIGSSAAICDALADGLRKAATIILEDPKP